MGMGLALVLGALWVETDGDCPGAAQVRDELSRLRPAQPAGRLLVQIRGAEVWVELDGANGRSVPAPDDCQARARIVAVMVASWLGELDAPGLRLPEPPLPGAGWAFELTGGADWDRAAAGIGSLAVRLLPFRRLSFELGVHAQSVRTLPFGVGRAEYWRIGAQAGLSLLFRIGRTFGARVALSLLPGAFLVRGLGFDINHRSQAFDFGLRAGAQLGGFFDPLEVWVGPVAFVWPAPQRLIEGAQILGTAPQFEVGIVAAVAVGERFWRRRAWGSP